MRDDHEQVRCGQGHPTEWGNPGDLRLSCGCLAATATDQALREGGYAERPTHAGLNRRTDATH